MFTKKQRQKRLQTNHRWWYIRSFLKNMVLLTVQCLKVNKTQCIKANEFKPVDVLLKSVAIYAETIYELDNSNKKVIILVGDFFAL